MFYVELDGHKFEVTVSGKTATAKLPAEMSEFPPRSIQKVSEEIRRHDPEVTVIEYTTVCVKVTHEPEVSEPKKLVSPPYKFSFPQEKEDDPEEDLDVIEASEDADLE